MSKKIIAILALTALVSLSGCGEKKDTTNHIVDNEPEATLAAKKADATPDPTMPPAATSAPDAEQKAAEKISDGGSANATVSDNGETREVDLKFQLTNNTGIDFVAMLIEPVTVEIGKGSNRFPADFVFTNGTTIDLTPPAASDGSNYVLDTSLFNIAAIDKDGRGYVYPNIDLATSKSIVLSLEDGIPKAVIH